MRTAFFAFVMLAAFPSWSQGAGLQLSIQDGKVSLDAQDVTVRQILNEWARVGRTRIVNADRVAGGPITLKFEAVPEKQALDIVLRNVPGYMAAPRETMIANASIYDTIMIMATTTAVAAVRPPGPAFGGSQGRPPGNLTQLQPTPPPAASAEPADPASDQTDDPAIAGAAAAGLVTVPAPLPGGPGVTGPLAAPSPAPAPATTNKPPTSNPWNAPVGTAQPSLAPPPAPAASQPPPQQPNRPRPPQGDR